MNPNPMFILMALIFLPTGLADLAGDKAALMYLRSTLRGRLLQWETSEPTPCSWEGVTCGPGGVTELRLPGMELSGQIPPNTIGNLTHLKTLSLRSNHLSGHIPFDVAGVSTLQNLYLRDNQFSGEVPHFLYSLRRLVGLDLSYNNFGGRISPLLNKLSHLKILYLEHNNFSGSIPDLNLLNLVKLNVSHNQLTGPVPPSLARQPASAFSGNSLCGGPLLACPGTTRKNKKISAGGIAVVIIGSALGFFLILIMLYNSPVTNFRNSSVVLRRKKGSNRLVFFGERAFELKNFWRARGKHLGEGRLGHAYAMTIKKDQVVVVKRLEKEVPVKYFRDIMNAIGKMRHINLVPLMAYFCRRDEQLIISEYIAFGSLSSHIHGSVEERLALNWETRSKIALGIARGISYLHEQRPEVSHGNITPSNVLLSESYEARVSDFMLSQLEGPAPIANRNAGYRAPEVKNPSEVSQEADVFSFGLLVLELLTAMAPKDDVNLSRLFQYVHSAGTFIDYFEVKTSNEDSLEDMKKMYKLGLECVNEEPARRPSMNEVTRRIEELHKRSVKQVDEAKQQELDGAEQQKLDEAEQQKLDGVEQQKLDGAEQPSGSSTTIE